MTENSPQSTGLIDDEKQARPLRRAKSGDSPKRSLIQLPAVKSRAEAGLRIALLVVGFAFTALGVDFTAVANLGTSPVAAVPYVTSLNFSFLTFGGFMMIWQGILVAMQIIILRREFKLFDLLQIPASLMFGFMLDAFLVPLAPLSAIADASYAASFAFLLLGIVGIALGIALLVLSNLVMNCGEAVVKAVCSKTGWNFGYMKVAFDLACLASAAVISLVFAGSLEGVREGSIICAAAAGFVVNFFLKPLRPLYERLVDGFAKERPSDLELSPEK
ncbi:MAG: hypothetical protein IJC51_00945 [Eggerthellaceae bacterium]|nr:hypothetical protein [Eggerthellaceae bacterium]